MSPCEQFTEALAEIIVSLATAAAVTVFVGCIVLGIVAIVGA